ncbi:hypothetical protein NE237_010661 [Protea cynaroides]|uniref:Uncharacterized protein n=1 Tax=Protea cynaroides TaxID=273540 RepID=A0A9Q0L118_9MAGN|nr:hypothetical protein NE237_010661 [Protea cynaroides]
MGVLYGLITEVIPTCFILLVGVLLNFSGNFLIWLVVILSSLVLLRRGCRPLNHRRLQKETGRISRTTKRLQTSKSSEVPKPFSLEATMMLFHLGIPICVQCGTTTNPWRCKAVVPIDGFLAFVVAAVVEWPLGVVVYCFKHCKGYKIMARPADVFLLSVTNAILV